MATITPRFRSLLLPLLLLLALFIALLLPLCAGPPPTSRLGRFPDAHEKPPKNWQGEVFRLSQDYPSAPPPALDAPWSDIDFTKEPERYMRAVLKYAYQDNISGDNGWQPEKNTGWYHAPWLHWGDKGREFIRGMTRERRSRPCELADEQHDERQNWAVSVYNELGGYVIGRVWANPSAPNPAAASFPEGTVAIKLLFTQATPKEVPFLQGSPQWQAYIEVEPGVRPGIRKEGTLRLLQIDFAVRDKRADYWTGWVFGTFQYDVAAPGVGWNNKLTPVALTWGNDPGISPDDVEKKRAVLTERWINEEAPIVRHRRSQGGGLGWGDRANGPVDNQQSSCLSCHSTAQHPNYNDIFFPKSTLAGDKLRWFRNLKPGQSFGPEAQSLNYSLQLANGIANFYQWVESVQQLQKPTEEVSPPKPRIEDCKKYAIETAAVARQKSVESSAHFSELSEPKLLTIYPVTRDEGESTQPLKVLPVQAPPFDER